MATSKSFRLPRTVEPERYSITLTPDLEASRFTGEEKIQLIVHEATTAISFNSADLEILSAQLISDEGSTLTGAVSVDEESEVATFDLDEVAQPGSCTLHLTFAGRLSDKLNGFYRSTYTDDDGIEHVIATTQFEPTDARRAFPCWDEPEFKAVFAVTLIIDENLAAFSNGAIVDDQRLGTGKRQVEFADTMKMSTYLVAFIVGPLVVTDPVDVDGTALRVACVPGRQSLSGFALEAGAGALRYFTKYFDIPYPGGKLDLIALPDFAMGAMENLGCVTFRETALLVDPERASRLEVERVADVVGHEIAHMWFGDLVTMKWWNGIWLNEAFATFMELSFVHHFRPEWERWVSFGLGKSAGMNVDSLSSTRPIEFEVVRPEEAQGMFDLLTYEKGGAVLRMLEQHLGPETFRQGISAYLNKHAYANAETTDLWDALEESSRQPVRALMDSWIYQGGHPIVEVEATDDGTRVVLRQRRFRFLPDDENASWHVPISIRAVVDGQVHREKVLLTQEEAVVELPGKFEYIVVNEKANGFFRVSYTSELLSRLTSHIGELDSLERFTLMTDTWAACLSGKVDVSDVLSLIQVLKDDDDPNVWGAMLGPLRLLDKMIDDTTRARFRSYVSRLAAPKHTQLGWEPRTGENERAATLRGVIISALGALAEDSEVQREAARRYDEYEADSTTLDSNLVDSVESVLAATNESRHYELLLAKFDANSSTPQERINALQALACFTKPELVERTLAMIGNGQVRTQDAPYTLRVMLTRRATAALVWSWCEDNWNDLNSRFPDNSITRMVEGTTAQTDPTLAERVKTFMAAHPVPQAQKSIDQTCERLDVNVAFHRRNVDHLSEVF